VIEPRYVDEIVDGVLGDGWCSDAWEKLLVLRRCYVRPLSPDGDVEHFWQGHFEAALEARDTAHQIFRSQKDWELFLQTKKEILNSYYSRGFNARHREYYLIRMRRLPCFTPWMFRALGGMVLESRKLSDVTR
jgi:hypothetical protein